MKIVVINGSPRFGITYNAISIVMQELQSLGDVTFKVFNLPRDMPAFCKGCFQCFLKGEELCPDAKYVQPIVEAMDEADGFIIGTPVYAMQITGALKAFFDHLAYCYINHRPRFFTKKAMVIVTTVGAGINNCNRYIKQNLSFWGVNKVYTTGKALKAIKWDEIETTKKADFEKSLKLTARKFNKDIKEEKIYPPSMFQTVMFNISRVIINTFEKDNSDRIYWEKNGWLDDKVNYLTDGIKPKLSQLTVGTVAALMFKKVVKKK